MPNKKLGDILRDRIHAPSYVEITEFQLTAEDLLSTPDKLLESVTIPATEVKKLLKHIQDYGL